jgi:Ca2+-binding RTX toxin-like protein
MSTRLTTTAGSLVLAATALVPAAAAQQAAPTCHGKPATIVGTGHVVGTDRADVIVTHGAASVYARGGDDTICLGSAGDADGLPQVHSGGGDDYVQNRSGQDAWASLGRGDDRFVGGPAKDSVDDGDSSEDGPADLGLDTIATGGGADWVQTGEPGVPNHDRIDAGDGDDEIEVHTLDNADAFLAGGDGFDSLTASLYRPSTGDGAPEDGSWVFDNRNGTATLDGTVLLRWSGLEDFAPGVFGGSSHSFFGSDADETVRTAHPDVIDGGGGDDRLVAFPGRVPSRFDGGPGHDTFSAASDVATVTVDADPGHVSFDVPPVYGNDEAWDFTGFEEYGAYGPEVVVHGSAGPDVLSGLGCFVDIDAGDGDDHVTVELETDDVIFTCREKSIVAHGGPGDDVLTNGWGPSRLLGEDGDDRLFGLDGPDELWGGPGDDIARGGRGDDVIRGESGRDAAYGGSGADRCRAEVRTSCERR